MKKLILTLAIAMLACIGTYAQGTLQFNRVVDATYYNAALQPSSPTIGSITIPAGKVWKFESASAFQGSSAAPVAGFSATYAITVGDHNLIYFVSGGSYQVSNYCPVWLPAGTYAVKIVSSNNNAGTYAVTAALSAIEYNIVP
ncbi:MAG: hypothetical protein JSS76_15405 [Bacteroidetes bacterium]|nr:hypothetical protein [Bacteroidota bacterium]